MDDLGAGVANADLERMLKWSFQQLVRRQVASKMLC